MLSNEDFKALTLNPEFDTKPMAYKEEPLLVPNGSRFVLFPIQYNAIWQAYKNVEAKFWSAEEVEMSDDALGTSILYISLQYY